MIELNIKGEIRRKSVGISLDNFNYSTQLIICVVAIFGLYIGYGYCQEWIFQIEMLKKAGMFITLIQFFFYTIFGLLEKSCNQIVGRKTPMKSYYVLSLLTIATMGLSNASLGYLNYPTQVIFKSSKLIPVMIGGILIQGKRYGFLDVTSCLLMTAGVISFTAADFTVLPSFDPIGIFLISGALCADAAIGNYQELCLKKYKSSNAEMVLYSYGIGFFLLLIGNIIFQPDLTNLIIFVLSNSQVLAMIFFFSLTGYIGILFVLHLVRTFGALLAVTVTTCRKALTIVLSFVFFRKPFTLWYVFAGLLVVCGIFANVYSKQRKKREERTLPM